MATSNGSTAIRDKILASLARYRALRIGKFPCAFWRLSSRPGLTAVDPSGECVDTLWDVANVIYDIGKVSYGYLNNNQHAVSSGYADLGADLFALAIPGLPAGVTKAVNAAKKGLKYDPRVRVRGVEDPRSHNFPYSFDKGILNTKPSVKNNGYKIYQKKGAMIRAPDLYLYINPPVKY